MGAHGGDCTHVSSPEHLTSTTADLVLSEEDDGSLTVSLPADPSAVTTARRLVVSRWGHLSVDTMGDVELIVSELVSNAVRHGRPEIELRLRARPFAVDVGVLDHDTSVPPSDLSLPHDTQRTGRGLFMVDALSQAWGVESLPGGGGKTVWASVATGS
ncbi:ATP-binding protein [Jatrophihabitans sp. YIM 134969]